MGHEGRLYEAGAGVPGRQAGACEHSSASWKNIHAEDVRAARGRSAGPSPHSSGLPVPLIFAVVGDIFGHVEWGHYAAGAQLGAAIAPCLDRCVW